MASFQTQSFEEIDPAGDLILNIVEYDYATYNANGGHPPLRTACFKVSRQTLLDVAGNDYWKRLLNGSFQEANSNEVTLKDDSVASMELWLRVFHGTLVEDSYLIPVEQIWHAIELSRKYLFHLEKLNAWFETYWTKLDKKSLETDDLRALLFPCQALEHAGAFAYVTKRLANEVAIHIEELNPTRFRHLRCEGRVIQQLNAVRGSMRGKIIAGLFEPLNDFCRLKCDVHEKCIAAYLEGVKRTEIWPLQHQHHKSNKDVTDSIGFLHWKCSIPKGACYLCQNQLSGANIRKTRSDLMSYWEGLCLDCMDISQPKTGDSDTDYWLHNRLRIWGSRCRLSHTRNTWYFSFMGRPEVMTKFQQEQQARKKAERYHSDQDTE
ncbi:hypothetical protein LHYA1_G001871 [Lachnellula hyalina]|uniref:Uncharacterized protein n=1 Tax=Lachnellula hyalina TaxID=1316788 RepID=A0A8H8R6E0_9HELO|nr:uncharacterized protein LHYA1_G001871 [Lachnellula hyalina]TVY29433.1 hypothetical protein LHYA1_G001871 [Lachnellula hyalina]